MNTDQSSSLNRYCTKCQQNQVFIQTTIHENYSKWKCTICGFTSSILSGEETEESLYVSILKKFRKFISSPSLVIFILILFIGGFLFTGGNTTVVDQLVVYGYLSIILYISSQILNYYKRKIKKSDIEISPKNVLENINDENNVKYLFQMNSVWIRYIPYIAVLLVSATILANESFFGTGYLNVGDIVFPFLPETILLKNTNLWTTLFDFGGFHTHLALWPYYFFIFLLNSVFQIPLIIVNRLIFIAPLLLIGFSSIYLGKVLFNGRYSTIACTALSVFLLVSPALTYLSVPNIMFAFSGTILFLGFFIRGLKYGQYRKYAILASLSTIIFSIFPQVFAFSSILVIGFLIVYLPQHRETLSKKIFFSIGVFFISIFFNLYWLIPEGLVFLGNTNIIQSVYATTNLQPYDVQYTSFLFRLRLLYFSNTLIESPLIIAIQYIIITFGLSYPLLQFIRRRRLKSEFFPFFVLFWFLLSLYMGKSSPIYMFFWNNLSIFQVFRNPNYIMLPISLVFAILIGFSVNSLLYLISNVKYKYLKIYGKPRIIIFTIILVIFSSFIIAYGLPGPISQTNPISQGLERSDMNIPAEYFVLDSLLTNTTDPGGRLIVLPWAYSNNNFTWFPNRVTPDITPSFSSIGTIVGGMRAPPPKVQEIIDALGNQSPDAMARRMGSLGIKYVLIHLDTNDISQKMKDTLRNYFDSTDFFVSVAQFDSFLLYKINDKIIVPKIFLTSVIDDIENKLLRFDEGYFVSSNTSSLELLPPFTISMWVNEIEASNGGAHILSSSQFYPNLGIPAFYFLTDNNNAPGNVQFGVASSTDYTSVQKEMKLEKFHNLVGVVSNSSIEFYIDGLLAGNNTLNAWPTYDKGIIPFLQWPLDIQSEEMIDDQSIDGNWIGNVQAYNSNEYNTIPNVTYVIDDIENKLLRFDEGYFVSSNTSSLELLPPFTISMWVNEIEASNGGAHILSSSQFYPNLGIPAFYFLADNGTPGNLQFGFASETGYQYIDTSVEMKKFHHIVGIISNSSISLFIDGLLISTKTLDSIPIYTNNNSIIYLGANPTSNHNNNFNGFIRNIQFYNSTLTPSQVSLLYFEGINGDLTQTASGVYLGANPTSNHKNNFNGFIRNIQFYNVALTPSEVSTVFINNMNNDEFTGLIPFLQWPLDIPSEEMIDDQSIDGDWIGNVQAYNSNEYLTSFPNLSDILAASSNAYNMNIKQVSFQTISSVLFSGKLDTGKHTLVLNEQFNNQWELKIDGKEIKNHYLFNGFANAWTFEVDKSSDFTVKLLNADTVQPSFYITLGSFFIIPFILWGFLTQIKSLVLRIQIFMKPLVKLPSVKVHSKQLIIFIGITIASIFVYGRMLFEPNTFLIWSDAPFEFFTQRITNLMTHSWDFYGFGSSVIYLGGNVWLALLWTLHQVFPSWIVDKIVYLLPLLVRGFSVYYLLSIILKGNDYVSIFFKLLPSIFFIAIPLDVYSFPNSGLALAVMPLMLAFYIKGTTSDRKTIYLGLAALSSVFTFINPVFALLAFGMVFLYFIISIIDSTGRIDQLIYFGKFFILLMLFNMFVIIPFITAGQNLTNYIDYMSSSLLSLENLEASAPFNTLSFASRLLHGAQSSHVYFESPIIVFLGFYIVAYGYASLRLLKSERKGLRIFAIWASVLSMFSTLFATGLAYPVSGWLYIYLYNLIPGLFYNVTYFLMPLAIGYTSMLGITTYLVIKNARTLGSKRDVNTLLRKFLSIIVILIMIISIIAYIYPVYVGYGFRGNNSSKIPQDYFELNELLDSPDAYGNWLYIYPRVSHFLQFTWSDQSFHTIDIVYKLLPIPVVGWQISHVINEIESKALQDLESGNLNEAVRSLGKISVKYIFVHKDVIGLDSSNVIKMLSTNPNFTIIKNSDSYALFEIRNSLVAPMLHAVTGTNISTSRPLENHEILLGSSKDAGEYTISIPANEEILVILNQAYSDDWVLSGNNIESRREIVNGFANGWFVKSEEETELRVSLRSDMWVDLGASLSIASIVLFIAFIVVNNKLNRVNWKRYHVKKINQLEQKNV